MIAPTKTKTLPVRMNHRRPNRSLLAPQIMKAIVTAAMYTEVILSRSAKAVGVTWNCQNTYHVPYAADEPKEAAISNWIVLKNGTGQNEMPYENASVSNHVSQRGNTCWGVIDIPLPLPKSLLVRRDPHPPKSSHGQNLPLDASRGHHSTMQSQRQDELRGARHGSVRHYCPWYHCDWSCLWL